MNKINIKKLTLTAIFVAISVVGSIFSFPVFGSKCAPVQHMVNVFCAIFLGPWYGLVQAFLSSLIRNLLGLGTLLAFPGSMCGALLSGVLYAIISKKHLVLKRIMAYAGEIIGTGVIGGMLAFPIAALIMGNAQAGLFTFVIPFLISTVGGTIIAIVVVEIMAGTGILKWLKGQLEGSNGKQKIHDTDGRSPKGDCNEGN